MSCTYLLTISPQQQPLVLGEPPWAAQSEARALAVQPRLTQSPSWAQRTDGVPTQELKL